MIKENELRIGNWVKYYSKAVDNKPFQIISIEKNNDWGGGYCVVDEVAITAISNLEPIPLTEQWLLDFGFKKINGKYFKVGFQLRGNKVADDIGYHFKKESLSIEITHVHQLQNLYFSLTGKELTLKNDVRIQQIHF